MIAGGKLIKARVSVGRKCNVVPPNADKHWGCPRRDQCDFAHGIDELTGEGKAAFLREQEQLKKEAEKQAIESYISYQNMADDAMKAVEVGLQLKKKEKKKEKRSFLPLDLDEEFGKPTKMAKTEKRTGTSSHVAVASNSGEEFASRLSLLSGQAIRQDDGIVMGERTGMR